MSVAINIEHAVKKYGDTTVIPDLSVSVKMANFLPCLDLPDAEKPHC